MKVSHAGAGAGLVVAILVVIIGIAIYDLLLSALHSMFPSWSENAIRLLIAIVLIIIVALIVWFSVPRRN
jgi:hypothetical protein